MRTVMMIPGNVMKQILAQARRDVPIETCGYLIGMDGYITQCIPIRNDDQAEDHFTFDAEEQLAAIECAEREGLDIIALYHSHPKGDAWPSAEDVKLAFDPLILYVIIGLTGTQESVRAFHIIGGKIEEEPIIDNTQE
jgi:[CysO sulfur-carrier protein]-S-L-cysteine hydrolase